MNKTGKRKGREKPVRRIKCVLYILQMFIWV